MPVVIKTGKAKCSIFMSPPKPKEVPLLWNIGPNQNCSFFSYLETLSAPCSASLPKPNVSFLLACLHRMSPNSTPSSFSEILLKHRVTGEEGAPKY
jgi:hypothetical protein